MEDGSIFVCFLCEKEFRQVSLLQEHMKEHGTLPEMSEEFPSRKKSKTNENGTNKVKTYGSKKSKINVNTSLGNVENLNDTSEPKESFFTTKIKTEPKCYPAPKSKVTSPLIIKEAPVVENVSPAVEDKIEDNAPPPDIKIKCDPDEFNLAMKRAMRIKKYIERKENTAKRKLEIEVKGEEETDEISELQDLEFEGAQESIMMVDSSFFTSGGSKTPIGPTIMNSEPEGFMVPQKLSLGQNLKKKKKIKLMNENYIVQEVYFDGDNADGGETFEYGTDVTNHVQMIRHGDSHISRRGRGRGRGKRGRPAKIKEEQLDDISLGYYKEIRPGRRSKPRNIAEEDESGPSYQCLECCKEFRSISTMRVHMKSHAEDREIPCPYCDEVFPQRYILYEHLVNDHEESSNLTCPVCSKIFTRPDSLKSHMVRMHEENGGLNCFVCGKNFPSQGQLEMHVRVHTGERPFKCDICRKGFVQKVHLRTHLRTMHNMTEANTTPCRICEKKFDGRSGLREHFTNEHGLTTAQYKNQVAKLRKEGKIPEVLPPKVKVVDPSFRYQKVPISEVKDASNEEAYHSEVGTSTSTSSTLNGPTKPRATSIYMTRRAGRKLKIKTKLERAGSHAPGMGTVMNLVSDDMMFTPMSCSFDDDDDEPKGRDQEELRIVESAFKVAEEMDQLKDGSSATILMTDNSGSSGIYYSLPIDMQEDADDEYAQFAAEHAHLGIEQDENEIGPGTFITPSSIIRSSKRGAIVKAEPLEIYSDNMETVQAIEMLTM